MQDGPYKFHGLPGLIVKIEDQTQSHVFTLQEVKNLNISEENYSDTNETQVSTKQYTQLIKDFENNPLASAKKVMMSVQITAPHIDAKEQEKRMKDRIKKHNNRIELITFL